MRGRRQVGKLILTGAITFIFCVWSLAQESTPAFAAPSPSQPPPRQQAPRASVAGGGILGVPEDPLGQQGEQRTPEISVDVDVRDGHLIARVVDDWGPGRSPFVVRSYTNTAPMDTSAAGTWHINRLLDISPGGVREPDGNRSSYTFLSSRATATDRWDTYEKRVGPYSTMELHYALGCSVEHPETGACRAYDFFWDGFTTIYLPKGFTRKFNVMQFAPYPSPGSLILREQDASGNVTGFSWTSFPDQADKTRFYITIESDPAGRETTYGYEHANSVVDCRERPEGMDFCVTLWYYRLATVRDPWGRTVRYTYDASNRVVTVSNAAGQTTQYGYSGDLLTSITDARGSVTTIVWTCAPCTPTPINRVSQVIAPDQSSTAYTYPLNGPGRTVVTDARGYATTYEMDGVGNIIRSTDPLGGVTQLTYDANQNVTQVTDARSNRTTYAYNGRNRVTQIVQAAGVLNLTTALTWDDNGNLLTLSNPRNVRTEYTYDAANRLTAVRRAATTPDESRTQYTYTTWGGVDSVTDPRGNTTRFSYTPRRLLQTTTPPAGGPTQSSYDSNEDLITRTDGNNRNWAMTYNTSRQVITATDPLGNRVRFEYDPGGYRTRSIDAKGQASASSYDSRGRLTAITDALTQITRYEYDAVSNLTRVVNVRSAATTFAYDQANRMTRVTDALNQSTSYGYDPAGNRTSSTDRKGQAFAYTYDQANRLTQVNVGTTAVGYTYDADGNRLTMADGTGTTTYAYDNLDRRTQRPTRTPRLSRLGTMRRGTGPPSSTLGPSPRRRPTMLPTASSSSPRARSRGPSPMMVQGIAPCSASPTERAPPTATSRTTGCPQSPIRVPPGPSRTSPTPTTPTGTASPRPTALGHRALPTTP